LEPAVSGPGRLKRASAELCKQSGIDELKRTKINTGLEEGIGYYSDYHGAADFIAIGGRHYDHHLEGLAGTHFISTRAGGLPGAGIYVP
jgi:hypothetical protein